MGRRFTVATSAEKLTLTIDPATGLFAVNFLHPSTRRFVPVSGIVVPDQRRAAGFFFTSDAAGTIELVPR